MKRVQTSVFDGQFEFLQEWNSWLGGMRLADDQVLSWNYSAGLYIVWPHQITDVLVCIIEVRVFKLFAEMLYHSHISELMPIQNIKKYKRI